MEALKQPLAKSIRFSYPKKTRAISITGEKCDLNCAHCGGHYLKHMQSLENLKAGADNSASWLISGGCRSDGSVPVAESVAKLAELKEGRKFNMHVGLVSPSDIELLSVIADCVSFDFVTDQLTIDEVFGSGRAVEDYIACYRSLRQRIMVIPHICIGLKGGEIIGERRSLELLRELGADVLTFIVFMPTRGTRYQERKPPPLMMAVELMKTARQMFPDIPLNLGCMRPGGAYREELDKWAVRIGFDTIVNPAPAAVRLAQEMDFTLLKSEECCVL